jgi:4-amino-4-deoxy-L-arabinose transferase-like glycosyltransferase
MITKHLNKFLIVIILIAAVLRLWNLNVVPPSASLDESSIGYNAYSVIKTGGDEFGTFPLISQRGYDDYRRSTYLLLVAPFVSVLGLNVIAVRLPAVILSILTVWAVFGIVRRLVKKPSEFGDRLALVSALILATSPWHIYISRIGHESNACLSFFVFAVLFFLKGLENKKLLLVSVLFFALALVSYYSGQVLVPLFVLALVVIYRKQLLKIAFSDNKSKLITMSVFLLAIPIVWSVFSPEALIRFRGTSTFSPSAHEQLFKERVLLRNKAVANHEVLGSIIYNQRLFPLVVLFQGYIDHFNPQWLFFNNSNGIFKAPHEGLLYPWQIIFILIGIFALVKTDKLTNKSKLFLIIWLLLGALPASIATQTPHAMRSYNILPAWEIFTALGLTVIIYKFYKFRLVLGVVIGIFFIFSLQSFLTNYFVTFPKEQSKSFQYAYGKALGYVITNQDKYQKIIVSNKDNMFQSYMIFLYYSKYDPSLYQKQGGTKSGGYDATHFFGKYEFRTVDWNNEKNTNTLYVLNPQEVPVGAQKLYEGKYLDGTTGAIVISR